MMRWNIYLSDCHTNSSISIYMSIYPVFIRLYVCLLCLFPSICLSILSISVYMSIYFVYFRLYVCLSCLYPSIRLSTLSISVYMSIYLVCIRIYVYLPCPMSIAVYTYYVNLPCLNGRRIRNLQIRYLQILYLQIRYLQIRYLQIRNQGTIRCLLVFYITLCKIRKYFIFEFAIIFLQPLLLIKMGHSFVYHARRWRIRSSACISMQ